MARKKHHEEHLNHEAWAIPYGDLITLLLAFFVVMYAISNVNESKYRVLSDSLSDAFSGPPRSVAPVQPGQALPSRISQYRPLEIRPPLRLQPPPLSHLASAWLREQELKQQMSEQLSATLREGLVAGDVAINIVEDGVQITVASDFLFASGSARVEGDADLILQRIAAALRDSVLPVRVEGHTDNLPISTVQFPSNWELSAARAAWVVRRLAENGVDAERLSMLGYGQFRPLTSNDSEAGRRANRRVAIIIETGA